MTRRRGAAPLLQGLSAPQNAPLSRFAAGRGFPFGPLVLSLSMAVLSLAASAGDLKKEVPSPRAPDRRVRPIGPATHSTALQALNDCDEVRSYLIDVAVERVLEYRYNWWFMVPWAGGGDGRDEAADVPSDYTTTNTQEQGVDEIDIVKTNGTHLYAVEGDRLHILRSWPAEATVGLATVAVPDYSQGLFLRNDRVLVASQVWNPDGYYPFPSGGTRLQLLDVSDPSAPTVLRTIDVEGQLADARLIDGDLYAVIR